MRPEAKKVTWGTGRLLVSTAAVYVVGAAVLAAAVWLLIAWSALGPG